MQSGPDKLSLSSTGREMDNKNSRTSGRSVIRKPVEFKRAVSPC